MVGADLNEPVFSGSPCGVSQVPSAGGLRRCQAERPGLGAVHRLEDRALSEPLTVDPELTGEKQIGFSKIVDATCLSRASSQP